MVIYIWPRHRTKMSFNKGYTPNGFADQVFHIHTRLTVDDTDEILFRDYPISHRGVAKEYEKLKLSLCNHLSITVTVIQEQSRIL